MSDSIFFILITGCWLACSSVTYLMIRPQVIAEGDSELTSFCATMVFWWLMLPAFATRIAWLAAAERYQQIKIRREVKALRSGTENGLYEPVEN